MNVDVRIEATNAAEITAAFLRSREIVLDELQVTMGSVTEYLARETMEVYAPLANRLGIWQMKWELEDLAFRALSPEIYREIKALLADKRTARTQAIEDVIALLKTKLDEVGIAGRVSGRPKHIYSIYKKMQRKKLGYEHIYDVSAVRVIGKPEHRSKFRYGSFFSTLPAGLQLKFLHNPRHELAAG